MQSKCKHKSNTSLSDKHGLHPVMLAHIISFNPVPCIISMVRLSQGLTCRLTYDMIPKATMRNCVKTTPEDQLIILSEFLMGNEAHTMSSSIQVQMNFLRVQVNCSRASVKLHLSCTIHLEASLIITHRLLDQTLLKVVYAALTSNIHEWMDLREGG